MTAKTQSGMPIEVPASCMVSASGCIMFKRGSATVKMVIKSARDAIHITIWYRRFQPCVYLIVTAIRSSCTQRLRITYKQGNGHLQMLHFTQTWQMSQPPDPACQSVCGCYVISVHFISSICLILIFLATNLKRDIFVHFDSMAIPQSSKIKRLLTD